MIRPEVARRLYGDRTLINRTDADGESVAGWPEVAYESVRAINPLTFGGPMPAPLVYDVLGNLKGVGHMLPQAFRQLSDGLAKSLSEFDVYDHNGDPQESVTNARAYLAEAAEKAAALGALIEAAQVAINSQGYRSEDEGQ